MAKPFLTFSTIQFVTACAIEVTPSLQETFSPEAACHTRSMSGDSLVYIIFIFPRSIPYKDYKDALPSICDFVDLANDLLSFYKEEVAGEECNLVSYLHKGCSNGATKVDVLEWVMQRATHCYYRSLELLKTKETREALRLFAQGMLEFHLQSKRYRLSEMGLGSRLESL
ncbi:terpenoid synthase [Cylindrobasidium torrendii FP15055 ss-10]|uniref:Terpenoid synthase n=1 Tax=Cylindrobasidium torrendii FP15055 ss-10 TaxID=1314674 RepID=A0A0D7BF83_9AGAR|nr:terpenoid synthase [Cylindrobasidium torrendii FP15055 ss-10]